MVPMRRKARSGGGLALFHFTCLHGANGIIADMGFIKPHPQPMFDGVPLAWFTTMAEPDRIGLGLTSTVLDCDRLAFRFMVHDHPTFTYRVQPFRSWLQTATVDPVRLSALTYPGTRPETWYVATEPIRSVLAPWG